LLSTTHYNKTKQERTIDLLSLRCPDMTRTALKLSAALKSKEPKTEEARHVAFQRKISFFSILS
jgi:hypothetical protein